MAHWKSYMELIVPLSLPFLSAHLLIPCSRMNCSDDLGVTKILAEWMYPFKSSALFFFVLSHVGMEPRASSAYETRLLPLSYILSLPGVLKIQVVAHGEGILISCHSKLNQSEFRFSGNSWGIFAGVLLGCLSPISAPLRITWRALNTKWKYVTFIFN